METRGAGARPSRNWKPTTDDTDFTDRAGRPGAPEAGPGLTAQHRPTDDERGRRSFWAAAALCRFPTACGSADRPLMSDRPPCKRKAPEDSRGPAEHRAFFPARKPTRRASSREQLRRPDPGACRGGIVQRTAEEPPLGPKPPGHSHGVRQHGLQVTHPRHVIILAARRQPQASRFHGQAHARLCPCPVVILVPRRREPRRVDQRTPLQTTARHISRPILRLKPQAPSLAVRCNMLVTNGMTL